jgi:hypothetical protein
VGACGGATGSGATGASGIGNAAAVVTDAIATTATGGGSRTPRSSVPQSQWVVIPRRSPASWRPSRYLKRAWIGPLDKSENWVSCLAFLWLMPRVTNRSGRGARLADADTMRHEAEREGRSMDDGPVSMEGEVHCDNHGHCYRHSVLERRCVLPLFYGVKCSTVEQWN